MLTAPAPSLRLLLDCCRRLTIAACCRHAAAAAADIELRADSASFAGPSARACCSSFELASSSSLPPRAESSFFHAGCAPYVVRTIDCVCMCTGTPPRGVTRRGDSPRGVTGALTDIVLFDQ